MPITVGLKNEGLFSNRFFSSDSKNSTTNNPIVLFYNKYLVDTESQATFFEGKYILNNCT